jgi:hypothetical protein
MSITYRNGVTPSDQSIKTDTNLRLRSGMYTTRAASGGSNIKQRGQRRRHVAGVGNLAQYIPWWLEAKHNITTTIYDHLLTITLRGAYEDRGQ